MLAAAKCHEKHSNLVQNLHYSRKLHLLRHRADALQLRDKPAALCISPPRLSSRDFETARLSAERGVNDVLRSRIKTKLRLRTHGAPTKTHEAKKSFGKAHEHAIKNTSRYQSRLRSQFLNNRRRARSATVCSARIFFLCGRPQ